MTVPANTQIAATAAPDAATCLVLLWLLLCVYMIALHAVLVTLHVLRMLWA